MPLCFARRNYDYSSWPSHERNTVSKYRLQRRQSRQRVWCEFRVVTLRTNPDEMNDRDDSAWVFDSLIGFLQGPIWSSPLMTFIEEKSLGSYGLVGDDSPYIFSRARFLNAIRKRRDFACALCNRTALVHRHFSKCIRKFSRKTQIFVKLERFLSAECYVTKRIYPQ